MRRLATLSLLIAMVRAPSATADADAIGSVDTYEGTFEATQHDEVALAGSVDDRTLSNGTMKLQRVAPGQWKGTASAHLVVRISVNAQGSSVLTTGEGDVSGTVELRLRGGTPRYQLSWKLGEVPGTTRVVVPGASPQTATMKVGFKGGGMFEANATLPESGLDLIATDEAGSRPDHKKHVHWELKAKDDLVAIPRVAAVERGRVSHLDGTASTPRERIQSYEWTLDPGPDCPAKTPRGFTLQGAELDVTLLCSMKATLVVSDGSKRSAPAATMATITPRTWKTTFEPLQGPIKIPAMGMVSNHMQLGQHMCAVEPEDADPPGHVFHRTSERPTWKDDAYVLTTVDDPRSPFHGWAYVREYKGRYVRRIRINRELYAESATGTENRETGHARDLELVRACAEKHERQHDRFMRAEIAGAQDPGPKLEKLIAPTEDGLVGDADDVFQKLETFFAATNFFEAKVHQALAGQGCGVRATIRVKTPAEPYRDWRIPKVSDLGDEAAVP